MCFSSSTTYTPLLCDLNTVLEIHFVKFEVETINYYQYINAIITIKHLSCLYHLKTKMPIVFRVKEVSLLSFFWQIMFPHGNSDFLM